MKLCECGCGRAAPVLKRDRPERGQKKGDVLRFVNGHNSHRHTDECKRRIAAAGRGRKPSEETRKKLSESKRGASNPAWRGGSFTRRKIRWVYLGRSHPMAYRSGYAMEHRLVMARAIGRPLRADEHVHHLDLDSLNNDPSNLIVVSPSEHSRIHRLIDWHGVPPLDAAARVLNHERAAA